MTSFDKRTRKIVKAIAPDFFHEIYEREYNGQKYTDFIIRNGNKELVLGTEKKEYSFFFSTFHCHFTPNTEVDEESTLKKAILFIRDIISEKRIIVTHYDGDRITWGTVISSNEIPEVEPNRKIVIESWKDNLSKTIKPQKYDE